MQLRKRLMVVVLVASLGVTALAGTAGASPAKTVNPKTWATTFLTSGEAATKAAARSLKMAGTPGTSSGKKVAGSLQGAFTKMQQAITDAEAKLEALDPNVAEYGTQITAINTDLDTAIGKAIDTSNTYSAKHADKTLTKALKGKNACANSGT